MLKNTSRRPAPALSNFNPVQVAYDALVADTKSPRTRNALERVNRALNHLVSIGATDFSVANVARVIEALTPGMGPKEQSIRNAEGRIYRDLIDACRAAHVIFVEEAPRPSEMDDILAGIKDQVTAARVRDLALRLEEMTRRNEFLKRQYERLQPVEPRTLLGRSSPTAPGDGIAAPRLTAQHVRAVQRFMTEAPEMLECMWEDESGALLTLSGHDVSGAGFRQALHAVIATAAAAPAVPAEILKLPPAPPIPGRKLSAVSEM